MGARPALTLLQNQHFRAPCHRKIVAGWRDVLLLAKNVCLKKRPGVKFCVSVFRQSQEWDWKAGQILA